MSKLAINVSNKVQAFKKGTAFVIGVRNSSKGMGLTTSKTDVSVLSEHDLEHLGANFNLESMSRVAAPNGAIFALLGLGDSAVEKLNPDAYRALGGAIARNLKGIAQVVVDLGITKQDDLLALIEGIQLGNYEYNGLKSKANVKPIAFSKVTVITDLKVTAANLSRIQIIAGAVQSTRDLVNTPPNLMYPAAMVKEVQSASKGLGLSITVWDEKALAKDGFGGILAVGMGSSRPPRLVKLEYRPKGAKNHLALVGKGITFDTGGLSLKPAESMVGMKYDMTGAATAFQSVVAIAKLGLPVRVTAWLCLAENMPSGTAQRPDDVIKIRNGKTVEVLNTDAEGRLVLADGLSVAAEAKPDLILDIATLTGAATIALGNRYAGLMGDEKAVSAVQQAAKNTGELVWHMPLPIELRQLLNSDVADIANVKIGNRAGGMLIGGHFLREFVPSTIAWAHLDVAGPADNGGAAYGYTPKGGTGAILRTMVEVASGLAKAK
ncbi:leucyl aminopeptidase [Rhodoluna lacicola]|uniref:leucyl aminopeptidase n=1 Tax=Rhodoluna lacicola TaxID=529884 RepID=UPI00222EB637|nr:leucyl aminopeptidase [Rhodoluna lacicola]BDS50381.1 putative cytosol aminopeptidase [Rhodoluna lacicola]